MRARSDIVHVTLNSAMSQREDEDFAGTGVLFDVQNMRQSTDRGLLQKRAGLSLHVPSSINSDMPLRVATGTKRPAFISQVDGAPLLGDSTGQLYASDDADYYAPVGTFSRVRPVKERGTLVLEATSSIASMPSIAVNAAGFICVVTVSGSGVLVGYIESPEGVRQALFVDDGGAIEAFRPKVIAIGDVFYVVYTEQEDTLEGSTAFMCMRFTATTAGILKTATQQIELVADPISTVTHLGWDITTDGTYLYLALHAGGSSSAGNILLNAYNASLTELDSEVVDAAGNSVAIMVSVNAFSGRVWISWVDTDADDSFYRVYTFNGSAFTAFSSETQIVTGSSSEQGGVPLIGPCLNDVNRALCVMYRNNQASGDILRGTRAFFLAAAGSVSPANGVFFHNIMPIAKPDAQMGVWCLAASYVERTDLPAGEGSVRATTQMRAVLVRFASPGFSQPTDPSTAVPELSSRRFPSIKPLFRALVNTTNFDTIDSGFFSAPASGSSEFFAFPFVLTTQDDKLLARIAVFEYEYLTTKPQRQTLPVGRSAVVSGGVPIEVYGYTAPLLFTSLTGTSGLYQKPRGANEIGFLLAPEIEESSHVGGTGLGTGVYNYQAHYEWTDVFGRRHRSASSEPHTVTAVPSAYNRLKLLALPASQRLEGDSAGNQAAFGATKIAVYRTVAGGTEHQRLPTTFDNPATTGFVVIDDGFPDDQIANGEFLYTDGGVKQNDLAPSCTCMAKSEDRLWLGGLWRSNIIQASKRFTPDEPTQFTDHESHQALMPFAVTALAYQDGQIVAFGKDAIALQPSEGGPNNQGAGSFAPARIYTAGLGVSGPEGVLETRIGIFFKAAAGWYLIPRGFAPPYWIGAAVADAVEDAPEVLASAIVSTESTQEARFLVAPRGSVGGTTVLTYDLSSGGWYRDLYSGLTMMTMGSWPSGLAFARSLNSAEVTSPVLTEDASGNWADGAAHVEQRVRTGWIHPFGPSGWGEIRRVMVSFRAFASATIHLQAQVDDLSAQSTSWNVTASTALQYREILLGDIKGTRFQLEAWDAGAGGRGVKFVSFSVETQNEGGLRPTSPSERG